MSAFQYFRFSPLIFLPLAWLWFTLINHLRVEWSVNPQYAYGWAVPFLCLYLLWGKAESRKQKAESAGGKAETLKGEEEKEKAESRKQKREMGGEGNAEMLKTETLKSSAQRTEDRGQRSEVSGSFGKMGKAESGAGKAEMLKAETLTVENRPVLRRPSSVFRLPSSDLARLQYGSFSAFQLFSICLLAFLYLPTRLVQEANPEWRLVSWALAFEVIGLTLLTLQMTGGGGRRTGGEGENAETLKAERLEPSTHKAPARSPVVNIPSFGFSDFVFPICFFLVAVPWPTFIEGPLVQGLMRANVGATIELLALTGVPAIQHGNVIEIANGVVGVDDACSGIRSLQAALMLSLFFGEVYRLAVRRRLMLVVLGFLVAFVFNVGRTLLLTQVAAAKGIGAVATWHDPAGVTILVACFLCLWLMAKGLKGKAEILKAETLKACGQRTEDRGQRTEDRGWRTEDRGRRTEVRGQRTEVSGPVVRSQPSVVSGQGFSFSAFQLFSIFLTFWLILVEVGTEIWYRSHEWRLPAPIVWHVELPQAEESVQKLDFPLREQRALRFDEAINFKWRQPDNTQWQLIFMRWIAGQSAGHLAKGHTPDVCLTAAGRQLLSQSALHLVPVHGFQLPFRSYVFSGEHGPLHVFYCLWADRPADNNLRDNFRYASRIAPVLAGRRNSGQRSLEVAIWGIADQNEADAALARELEKLIHVEN